MARYILIDNYTGYIFGDTAALPNTAPESPIDAARAVDESIGEYDRQYTETLDPRSDSVPGYHVYRADINGSEAHPVVHDGQSRDEIEAVRANCELVAFVRAERLHD